MQKLYVDSLLLDSYQNLEIAVFIKDIKSHYLWGNDYFVKKSAGLLSSNEIVSKCDRDLSWHEYAGELRSNDELVFETRESFNLSERVLRANGNYINVISKKSPIFDKHHQLIGLIGFSLEVPLCAEARLLSKREHEIVLFISRGLTDKQVGKKLNISARTVETHIIHAKRKLNVTTRAELIVKICRFHP